MPSLCSDCKEQEAQSGRRKCYECWLAKQNLMVRIAAAQERLALVPKELRRTRVSASDCPPGRRFCAGCASFVRLRDVASGASRCRTCSAVASHASAIKAKYGIEPAEYARLFELQGGRCAICLNPPANKQLAVDHDHNTDEVRGLLCSRCNTELLGALYHDARTAMNAYIYLTTPPSSGEWASPGDRDSERVRTEALDTVS